ncbi:MAG: DUF1203 domain-containing protein [Candidatus Acidiferrum sp.]
MSSFQVVAIPTEVAESVRATGKAPVYGFPAHKETAAGRAPCRHCLQLIRVQEEELLLFTYDPFRELGEPPLPGPVYVHAEKCDRKTDQRDFPEEYRGRLLTLEAYGDDRMLLKERRLAGGAEEEEAEKLFGDPAVKYIHVRSTEAGCYLFRLERCAE